MNDVDRYLVQYGCEMVNIIYHEFHFSVCGRPNLNSNLMFRVNGYRKRVSKGKSILFWNLYLISIRGVNEVIFSV